MKNLSQPFDLIKKSIKIFSEKKNLIFFLKIYWPLIPFAGFSLVQQNLITNGNIDTESIWWIVSIALIQISYMLISLLVTIMGIIGIKQVVSQDNLSPKACYKSAKAKYWKFFLVSFLLGLMYIFGFALLIVPGMLFVVWFAFVRFITIESNLKIKEIFAKSRDLTKGIYWKVLSRLIVFGLFAISLEIVFSLIPFGLGVFVTPLLGALVLLPSYLLYKELSA